MEEKQIKTRRRKAPPMFSAANYNGEIKTFKGISFDAIHYYGKLVIDGVYVSDIDNEDKPKNLSYEIEKQYPLLNYRYELEIKRPLTKEEKEDEKYGDRWLGWRVGDLVDGYENMVILIEDVKEIMRVRFTGDWHFYYETPRGLKQEIQL